ncbi:GMC family oxidoreductase [Galbibacter orientalis]|uniref:GMC family oxidoreductase n=1 Tax=Galbibacter orientalis TaxID=453852 RepID=UPI003080D3D0
MNYINRSNLNYDAIVIGSGITGGWAAKELCEGGLKVLLLERGKDVPHITGYTNATKQPWELAYRGLADLENQQKGKKNSTNQFLLGKNEIPYIEKKPFNWRRGYQVGGKSLIWGRQCYRIGDLDFEQNIKNGIGIDWPIRYKDLAPWYNKVEQFIGVSGSKEGIEHLPDGNFIPPMELNCLEKEIKKRFTKLYGKNRHFFIGRTANLTTPIDGRKCYYRNKCHHGCPFGGYFSSQSSTLPAAMKTKNLTIRPFSIVKDIIYDKDLKKAVGVEIIDAETNENILFKSKIFFLCASTINSAAILMNSATNVWPNGLGSSSEELGHNFMDHHRIGAWGKFDGMHDTYMYGRRPNGIFIPRFRNVGSDKQDYIGGYNFQGNARRDGNGGIGHNIIGQNIIGNIPIDKLKDTLTQPLDWGFEYTAFGETLPYHENKITLSNDKKDKWGLPLVEIDAEAKENELKMEKDMAKTSIAMLKELGLKDVQLKPGKKVGDKTIGASHEMGLARMGENPKTAVLNKHNQIWDAKNVFVTDGSCMTSSACQNPSLTYMALTARAANFAIQELKKRNL